MERGSAAVSAMVGESFISCQELPVKGLDSIFLIKCLPVLRIRSNSDDQICPFVPVQEQDQAAVPLGSLFASDALALLTSDTLLLRRPVSSVRVLS